MKVLTLLYSIKYCEHFLRLLFDKKYSVIVVCAMITLGQPIPLARMHKVHLYTFSGIVYIYNKLIPNC